MHQDFDYADPANLLHPQGFPRPPLQITVGTQKQRRHSTYRPVNRVVAKSCHMASGKGTKKGLRVTETAGLPLIQMGLDWWRVMQIPIITVFVQ